MHHRTTYSQPNSNDLLANSVTKHPVSSTRKWASNAIGRSPVLCAEYFS